MLDEHGRLKSRHRTSGPDGHGGAGQGRSSGAALRYADPRFWRGLARQRRLAALGVVAALVAALALAALAWTALVWPGAGVDPDSPRTAAIPSRTSTPGALEATESTETTENGSAGETAAPASPQQPAAYRAPLVAFRRDGAIWLVSEAGGSARRVVTSASGLFSLAPDGSRIAVVEGATGRLTIVDAGTGERKDIGPAAAVRPDWSPDSQWVLFSRRSGAEDEIVRVAAGGYGETVLMRGVGGRFAGVPDLAVSAPRAATLPSQVVATFSDGRVVRIGPKLSSDEVCPAPKGLYLATAGGAAPPSIRYVGFEGGVDLVVVASPAAGVQAALSGLTVSPDGKWLVYTEARDDGYSRMFSRPSTGLKVIPLKAHRDSYFVGWSADGSELFRIEGNAAQGDATRLTALHPDGTGWRVVVEGAGL